MTSPDSFDPFANPEGFGFETRAIRAGQPHDPQTGAVTMPIHQSTTFAQEAVGEHKGFEYGRTGNPTRQALEQCLASLEEGRFGRSFASGMSATDAILRHLRPGDHLILGDDAYGGTFRLISRVYGDAGIDYSAVDLTDPDALAAAWKPNTKLVWLETPTNPLLTVFDIAAIAEVAHANDGLCVVDNTFATPYLQQPLRHGADIVTHSVTKYLGGHSDVVGGFVATNDEEIDARLGFIQNGAGAVPGPMDCFLTLRGVKTLAVRMDRATDNAEQIVEMLQAHPAVSRVRYPGVADHPGHEIAARQMSRFGAMVSFELAGGKEVAMNMAKSTTVFTLAESLGAVESLIEHPGAMTHLSAAGSPLEVPDSLLRLSVGIESASDLLNDLQTTLDAL